MTVPGDLAQSLISMKGFKEVIFMYVRCESCDYESDEYSTKKLLLAAIKCKNKDITKCKCPQCKKKTLTED